MLTGLDVETIGSASAASPALPFPEFPRFDAGLDRCSARRSRWRCSARSIAHVRCCRRSDERRSAQSERRAWHRGSPTSCRRCLAALPATGAIARTADEHPSGARDAGRRDPARGHAARRAARRRAAGGFIRWPCSPPSCSSSPTTWASGTRFRSSQADQDGHQRLARHVRADGLRRPDARRRSRHVPGGAALHPTRVDGRRRCRIVTPDYIEAGRAHILQDKRDSVLRGVVPHPRARSSSARPTSWPDHRRDRALPPIVIVRLRNMTAIDSTGPCARRIWPTSAPRVRPHAAAVRRAGAAGGADAGGGVPSACRAGEHLPQHRSGARPRPSNPPQPGGVIGCGAGLVTACRTSPIRPYRSIPAAGWICGSGVGPDRTAAAGEAAARLNRHVVVEDST